MDTKDMLNNDVTPVGEGKDGKDLKRVFIFLGLVFVLTYLYEIIFVVIPIRNNADQNIANRSLWVALAMFMPASARFLIMVSVLVEGPIVHMIFVLLISRPLISSFC